MLDMRKVEYFIKAADAGNINEASRLLYISHQALSKQIRKLEEDLGAQLLDRTPQGLVLTEVGRKLYEIFRPIVQQAEQGTKAMEEFVQYKKNILRVGFFSSLSYVRVITPILTYIKTHLPEIHIELQAMDIGAVMDSLMEDAIDVAVTVMPKEEEWDQAEYVIVSEKPQMILVSENHPWFVKDKVSAAEIAEENMLVYTNRPIDGENTFLPQIQAKSRLPIENHDTYMAVLNQGEAFGIVSSCYGKREGTYRLLELPEEYRVVIPVICGFKRLHPCADVLRQMGEANLELS